MTPLLIYLLKVNIALVLFYLAYRYGLRRLTFYTLNRFYLLFAIGFSSLYPLIDLNGFIKRQQAAGEVIIYYLPDLGSMATTSPAAGWNVLGFVFWSGAAIMAIRFLVQSASLARLHFASRRLGNRKQIQGKNNLRNIAKGEPRSRTLVIRIIKEKINPFPSSAAYILIRCSIHLPNAFQSLNTNKFTLPAGTPLISSQESLTAFSTGSIPAPG